MQKITAKCKSCRYRDTGKVRKWTWSGMFRKVDGDLLEIIQNQKNRKGRKCFFDIEIAE